MNKLDTIRINGVSYEIGGASDETVQALDTRLSNIESIIGDPNSADNDDVINKAVEVIDFFSNVPETDTLSGTLSNINNKFGNLGNKTEQLTYTAEEAAAYNTEHELQQGDDGYVTEGDVKIPAVPNTVKDVLDTKANKSEMSVEAGTGNNADKTTITLKTGTSATVLTSHQPLNNYYTKSECEAIFSTTSTYVPTLSAAPTSSTLSYTKDEVSHDFQIGDFCRVEDEPTEGEYTFYQLYDIDQTNGATWGKLSDDVINWITLDNSGNIVNYQRTIGAEPQSDTDAIMAIYKQAIIGNLGNKTEAVPAVYEAVTDGTTLTEGDTYYTSSTGEGEFTSDGTEVADGTNYYVLVSAAVPAVPYDIKSYVDDGLATKVALSSTVGLLKNDGTVDTNTYLTSHQDISGKQDTITDLAQIGCGYAVCSTASNVAAKEVTIPNFVIKTGAIVSVLFQNGFTTSNSTLNVSGTGAKPIYYRGAAISPLEVVNGMVAILQYDGTNWNAVSIERIVRNYGNDFVDLGLPSGTLWCKHNVGATNPEDAGLYFAFGYLNGEENGSISVYGNSYQNPYQASYSLPLSLDCARYNMGSPWRIPSIAEFDELFAYTTKQATTINGKSGFLFTAANGASVFFPVSGYAYNSVSANVKTDEAFLRTVNSSANFGYCYLCEISSSGNFSSFHIQRHACITVRPVQ